MIGIPIFAVGVALTPFGAASDVIVGNDGDDVVVRTPDGRLGALRTTKASFEARRWVEHDGHPVTGRRAKLPLHPDARCDGLGCTVKVKGMLLATSRHGATLRDDCSKAQILILDRPRPRGCDAPRIVIDFFDARYEGSHTLNIKANGKIDMQTVAKTRGKRPWTIALPGRRPWPGTTASPNLTGH